MKSFVFILLYAAHCNGQMEGGMEVESDTDFPYVVRVLLYDEQEICRFLCTGSIISRHYAITAAHCTEDERVKKVGITGGGRWLPEETRSSDKYSNDDYYCAARKKFDADEVIPHPQWASGVPDLFDVALIWFNKDDLGNLLGFDNYINMIQMVTPDQRWSHEDRNVLKRNVTLSYFEYLKFQFGANLYGGRKIEYDSRSWWPGRYVEVPEDSEVVDGEFTEFIPPAGADCKVITLGSSGIGNLYVPSSHIKKWDSVKILNNDKCSQHRKFNFCFGKGQLGEAYRSKAAIPVRPWCANKKTSGNCTGSLHARGTKNTGFYETLRKTFCKGSVCLGAIERSL